MSVVVGADGGEVPEVVGSAPRRRPAVVDLEAGAAVAAGVAAVAVALLDDSFRLLGADRLGAPDDDRPAVLAGEDGFDPGVGAEAFDHRVGQRHPGHGRRTLRGDVDHEMGPVAAGRRVVVAVAVQAAQLDQRIRAAVLAGVPRLALGGAELLGHLVEHRLDGRAVDIGE
jgi:hypothetical protein